MRVSLCEAPTYQKEQHKGQPQHFVPYGLFQLVITSNTFVTSSSSLFMRAELVSLCSRQWLSWTPDVILQHLWTKAAWEWAVMIHQSTAPFLRLNPTMLPFVLVLPFNICQIVWSTGTCDNPWDVARWTKSPFTRWVCASEWVSREQHHVGQVGWKIAQIEYCLEIQHG